MERKSEAVFLGYIGIWDADGVAESLDLYCDLSKYRFFVCSVSLPYGHLEARIDLDEFLAQVPDAQPIVRRLILEKFDPSQAAHEARLYRPLETRVTEEYETVS